MADGELLAVGVAVLASGLTWAGNAFYMSFKMGGWKSSVEGKIEAVGLQLAQFMESERQAHSLLNDKVNSLDEGQREIFQLMIQRGNDGRK